MEPSKDKSVALIIVVGTASLLLLLGLIVTASQVVCPSYMPLYSQPGLKLVYNITINQGDYKQEEMRIETVLARSLGNYSVNVSVYNLTSGIGPATAIYNGNLTFRIAEGLGMEELNLVDTMLPIGMREFTVSGITFIGIRYYDPSSGVIITADPNTGIILSIEYSGLGMYYSANLIQIEEGNSCHAW
ncbi:MAG: hypothetical protein QW039_01140 [Fervidicoccaceae archaeon]